MTLKCHRYQRAKVVDIYINGYEMSVSVAKESCFLIRDVCYYKLFKSLSDFEAEYMLVTNNKLRIVILPISLNDKTTLSVWVMVPRLINLKQQ